MPTKTSKKNNAVRMKVRSAKSSKPSKAVALKVPKIKAKPALAKPPVRKGYGRPDL